MVDRFSAATDGASDMDESIAGRCARRQFVRACATAVLASATLGTGAADPASAQGTAPQASNPRPGAMTPIPVPRQAPAKEALAELPDTRLFYWDTSGDGPPVILLHPASGSALIWGYQQPALARAGYRVIAYSRRGYSGSAPYAADKPGIGSEDLRDLLDHLGLGKVHLVASAAGGSIATDFALSQPGRLLSLSVSSNSLGVREGPIFQAATAVRPKGWDEMPVEFRELGPSYRAINPEGTRQWVALEHKALIGKGYRQGSANAITQAMLRQITVPTLLVAGAADLITPPSITRMLAAEIPRSETAVSPESGHSVYWEDPEFFNRTVLAFLAKHS
jgi:pimeloyl-ACP methyl ester carboxylesterase